VLVLTSVILKDMLSLVTNSIEFSSQLISVLVAVYLERIVQSTIMQTSDDGDDNWFFWTCSASGLSK